MQFCRNLRADDRLYELSVVNYISEYDTAWVYYGWINQYKREEDFEYQYEETEYTADATAILKYFSGAILQLESRNLNGLHYLCII